MNDQSPLRVGWRIFVTLATPSGSIKYHVLAKYQSVSYQCKIVMQKMQQIFSLGLSHFYKLQKRVLTLKKNLSSEAYIRFK